MHSSTLTDLMLIGAGIVTMTPLLMFALAAPRIPLATIGVLQFINPSIQFMLGVLIYKEPFDYHRLIGFGVVWAALILFGVEGYLAQHKLKILARLP